MSLAEAELHPSGPGRYEVELPDTWSSLQGVHGGFVAGLAVRAAQLALDDPSRSLRAATVGFLRGSTVGPCQLDVEVLRHGRALAACAVRASQNGKDICVVRLHLSPAWDGSVFSDAVPPVLSPPLDAVPLDGGGLVRHSATSTRTSTRQLRCSPAPSGPCCAPGPAPSAATWWTPPG